MNILKVIFRAPRPGNITDMPATVTRWWKRKNYSALTFFGYILTSGDQIADHLNSRFDSLKNHEMIHLRQAQNTHNSWMCFYARYLWYSLLAARYFRKLNNASYYLNPFEMEAYLHQNDMSYLIGLDESGGASGWREYAKMPLAERLTLMKEKYLRIE